MMVGGPIATVRAGADGGAQIPEREVVDSRGRGSSPGQGGLEVAVGGDEGHQAEEPCARDHAEGPELELSKV